MRKLFVQEHTLKNKGTIEEQILVEYLHKEPLTSKEPFYFTKQGIKMDL